MSKQEHTRGFANRCPLCGEEDALQVALDEVTTLICTECNEEIDLERVRAIVLNWQAILAWLETAPIRD